MIAPCQVSPAQIPKPKGTIQTKYLSIHSPSDCPSLAWRVCAPGDTLSSWVTLKFRLMTGWCPPWAPGHVGGFSRSPCSPWPFSGFIYFRASNGYNVLGFPLNVNSGLHMRLALFPLCFTFSWCLKLCSGTTILWLTLSYLIRDTCPWISHPSLPPSLSSVFLPSLPPLPLLFLFPLYWQSFLKATNCHRRFAQC